MGWVIGVIIFLIALVSFCVQITRSEKESRRNEEARREWKIRSGLDPRYDENGRLRK